VAWDRERHDWRTFRVDRIAGPASTGVRFAARELPANDAAAFVARNLSDAPPRYEARVTLHSSAEALRDRAWSQSGSLEPIDEHTCEYRTGDDDLDWLTVRIAMLDVDFDVHEPPELVERLRALARRLGRATPPRRARRAP
jgi:predicted DNA-binding transcriptional regulator YafY